MATSRKRKCLDEDLKENEGKQSSYSKMKCKMKNYIDELVQVRAELKETQKQKAELEAAVQIGRFEQKENKRSNSRGGLSSYAKLKIELEKNHAKLALVQIVLQGTEEELVKVRKDCSELRTELQKAKGMHNVNVSELRWELEEEKRKHEEDFMELCTDLQAVNSAKKGVS